VRVAAGTVIGRTIRESQGLYSDGWAGPVMRYMLPPGGGDLIVEGFQGALKGPQGQILRVEGNGRWIGEREVTEGDFSLSFELPSELRGQTLRLKISASNCGTRRRFSLAGDRTPEGDRRRLAFFLRAIRWADSNLAGERVQRVAHAAI